MSNMPPKPFFIGVSGGTASGKSSVCEKIVELLGLQQEDHHKGVIIISQDSFYKELSEEEMEIAQRGEYNFDHPDSFDFESLCELLRSFERGEGGEINIYDHQKFIMSGEKQRIPDNIDVVIVEGILTFYNKELRDMFHMKLFVDSDADTRLSRRVLRDTQEKGRDINYILNQYTTYVKPAFEEFCSPTKKYADLIIPRGVDNTVGIDLIVQHIRDVLFRRQTFDSNEVDFPPSRRYGRTLSESGMVSRPH